MTDIQSQKTDENLTEGDVVQLTARYCLESSGTKGVIIKAPALKADEQDALCVVFETSHYIYLSPDIPLNKIGRAFRYRLKADDWKQVVDDIRTNGICSESIAKTLTELDSFEDYGFGVFECEGILELKDVAAHSPSDRGAAKECVRLASEGDVYALACIEQLRIDADRHAGAGRLGTVHDYHFFEMNKLG
tara:strand:+ start:10206 stop:10778 length:573 start_codon:yes stop_codon:yes gene_type:complete